MTLSFVKLALWTAIIATAPYALGAKQAMFLQPVFSVDTNGTSASVQLNNGEADAAFCTSVEATGQYRFQGGMTDQGLILYSVLVGAGSAYKGTIGQETTDRLRQTYPDASLVAVAQGQARCYGVGIATLAQLADTPARQRLTTNAHYPRSVNVSVSQQGIALLVTEVNPGPWVIREIVLRQDASVTEVASRVDYRGKPQSPPVFNSYTVRSAEIREFYGKLKNWVKVTERQYPPSEKGNSDVRDALLEVLESYAQAAE